jgi:hypothetical protein
MAVVKLRIEKGEVAVDGLCDLGIAELSCVCAKCNNRDTAGASIEFNFRNQTVLYMCSKCKTMNEMRFGREPFAPPLPKSKMGH